jgi:hypothetical protein
MATIQREIRKRGFFGKLVKYSFIGFNLLMAYWVISYWFTVGEMLGGTEDAAARAGGAIGATLGTGTLLFFWVAGAIILGILTLLSRGQKIIVTEEA